jgi:hypothetical protein
VNVVLYLVLLIAGILCLVGGLFITRVTWRTDVEPFGRRSPILRIALRPEEFARADRLREIRCLNLLGGLLLLGALASGFHDVVATMGGR